MIAVLAIAIVAGATLLLRCEGDPPTLSAPEEVQVGRDGSRVRLQAADEGSGVRHLRVSLRHAGGEVELLDAPQDGNLARGAIIREVEPVEIEIDPKELGLADGTAFLVVEIVDWSWASLLTGNTAGREIPIVVDTTPPRVSVESGLTYVRRGGAGAVVYRVKDADRHGVIVGEDFFPGHPLGDEGRSIAIFAVPRNAPADPPVRVRAEDAVGNRTDSRWAVRQQARTFDDVPIRLSQGFLEGKVASLAGELGIDSSDLVLAFQQINRDERARNEARIREIVSTTSPTPYFEGGFLQMRNSAVTSRFAEHRSYLLDGVQISDAIHYGYDLASTAGAPIEASNTGVVLFADTLGIYGGCVIVDHGLGIATLYAHLASIDVNVDQRVERGQTLGRSGATGLAGGDHLHFAVLVGGTYVDPVEWWDAKWVRERIEARLRPPTTE